MDGTRQLQERHDGDHEVRKALVQRIVVSRIDLLFETRFARAYQRNRVHGLRQDRPAMVIVF